MNSFFHEFQDHLVPILRSGDLDECERVVIEQIRSLPRSPFDLSIEVNISNNPADAARHFDRFFEIEAQKITIAAAYTEMNGFDINPNLWFCDVFAYTTYGGHGDYDWLSRWQTGEFPRYPIRGMEALQAVYAGDAYGEESFRDAENMSSLLIAIKFQQFIRMAATQMEQLRFPLLVTAHDFDFIAEVGLRRPASVTSCRFLPNP